MKRLCYTPSSLAMATLALAVGSPALAETSAAELWVEWQAQAELTGQSVAAEVTETATGLMLTNFSTMFAEEDFTTQGTIDQIELIENPDGTVSVTYSELYSLTFTFEVDPGDPPGNIELQLRHENLEMTVSGDAGARVYAYSADRITVTDGAIWGGGDEPPSIDLNMEMTDIATTYRLSGTDSETMRFSSEGSLGGMSMVLELIDPRNPGLFKAGLVVGPMSAVSEGTVLSLGSMNQYDDALPDGFELAGTTTYGPLGFEFLFEEPGEAFAITYTNDGGTVGASVSPAFVTYDIAASGAQASVTGSELPVPVEISVGSSEIAFSMPLAVADSPQNVGLRLGLQNVIVGEQLLAMVDPGRVVPRDPASILLDATGQLQLFMDIINIDPEELSGPPGELRALTVNELRVAVGGAELTGAADMTFAPGQLIPMPVGSADIELAGGNTLMEALVAGGMVPPAQSGMIMGMANVFARPGPTPDTLETTVEFGADGSITANGVPLQ